MILMLSSIAYSIIKNRKLDWSGEHNFTGLEGKKGVSTLSRDFQDSQRPQIGWGEHP